MEIIETRDEKIYLSNNRFNKKKFGIGYIFFIFIISLNKLNEIPLSIFFISNRRIYANSDNSFNCFSTSSILTQLKQLVVSELGRSNPPLVILILKTLIGRDRMNGECVVILYRNCLVIVVLQ